MKQTIIIDPGHGMGNRKRGVYDPGSCSGIISEAAIVMDWANELRRILRRRGHRVVRTRADAIDPAPVAHRASIAKSYGGDIMISLHCNAHDGTAHGTETFYRGPENKAMAARLNIATCEALGTGNRGAKTEGQSQHKRLAIMNFQPCFLIELGFIDHPGDRAKMLSPTLRTAACEAIAAEMEKR